MVSILQRGVCTSVYRYTRGESPQEKAASITGLDRMEFLLALAREQVDVFVVGFNDRRRELDRG